MSLPLLAVRIYLKRIPQKESPFAIIRTTIKTQGITGLYSGCSALIIGNATKAGVRFLSYDHFKQMLADSEVLSCSCILWPFFSEPQLKGKSKRAEEPTRCVFNDRLWEY